MTSAPTFGASLRLLRLAADLTLEGLAERTGVSARSLSDIERGVSRSPQRRTVDLIISGLALDGEQRQTLLKVARANRALPAEGQRATAVAPHRVDDFTGREREIAELVALMGTSSETGRSAAVVISGSPGIGKTTGALEALSRTRTDGQPLLFVDLGGFGSNPLTPLQVLRALLRQMPGIGEKVPMSLDEAVILWQEQSSTTPALVLLDNAGHESQVRPVLTLECSNRIVITSRRTLAGLEAVRRVSLGPLSSDESVALLAKLIPAAQRSAGDLCVLAQLCDHVPLAMRITGNRIASRPASSAADFIDRLRSSEDRLQLLVAGDLAVEAAFALSYDDLDPQTALLFRSLGVIADMTFDARISAATIGGDVHEIETQLDELVDLGLLDARGGNRFRLHDLMRLFAEKRQETLDGPDEIAARRHNLRMWLLRSLERAGAWFELDRTPQTPADGGVVFSSPASAEVWIRLEEHHWWPALREAAADGKHELVVDVADALHWFSELWLEWGHWLELFTLATESARVLGDRRLEAMHLGYMVWATVLEKKEAKDSGEGLRLARLAVSAAEDSQDHQQQGWAYYYLGWMLPPANVDEALEVCNESIAQFELAGDGDGMAQAMILISTLLARRGDHEGALAGYRRVIDRADRDRATSHGLVQMITELSAYQRMSASYIALEGYDEAERAAASAVTVAERFGSATRVAEALRNLAFAHLAAGKFCEADNDISTALTGLGREVTTKYHASEQGKLEALRQRIGQLDA